MKRTYAEINLNTLRNNIQKIRGLVGQNVKLMGVVKADGYGHGAVNVSKVLEEEGADYLGVAWAEEGIELRENNIKLPILVLSEQDDNIIPEIVNNDLSQTVYTLNFAKKLSEYCKKNNKTIKIHIKLDTGMGRVGVQLYDAEELVSKVRNLPNLKIEGIFTHFSKADEKEDNYTLEQLRLFKEKAEYIKKNIIDIPLVHAANSSAAENFPETHLDMARIGIALYKNVLKFKTKVAYIKEVDEGVSIGYGGTYVTKNRTKIATIPAGYADGYNRLLSNNSDVLINGKKYHVVGRVSMDMITVDIGLNCDVKLGDDVVLIGEDNGNIISAEEIAKRCSTIDYEILCSIGKRVPRYFVEEKKTGCVYSSAIGIKKN